MEYVKKDIPLWQVTTWDKKFNNVAKEWQPKTIKYNYLLSDELDDLRVDDGNVVILYTGKDSGVTTEELAGENLSEGEIVSIPWGGIPTVKYCKGKFVTGDNRIATSNDTEELTNKYLYYFMKGNIQKIASFYRGASLKHPCMKDILKMTISYPTVEVQYQICKQFESLENIIKERKLELELLDNLIKARFVEMFGNPELNEKKWKIGRLGDKCKVINGRAYKASELCKQGKYKVLRVGNFFTNDSWYYSDLELEDDKYCEEGDLLFAWSASFGPRIWHGEKAIYHYHIWKLSGYENWLDKNFFVELLNYNCEVMRRSTHGSTMLHFTKNQMENQQLIIPPIEIQNQFADFVHQVDKSKVASDNQLENIAILLTICSIIYTNLNGNMGRIPYDN